MDVNRLWALGSCIARCVSLLTCEGLGQRLAGDGFGQVIVHACGQTRFSISRHRVGRHGYDGDVSGGRMLGLPGPDLARGAVSIENRHLTVHQDQVVATRVGDVRRERGFTIPNGFHHVPEPVKLERSNLLIDRIVFGQEHAQVFD